MGNSPPNIGAYGVESFNGGGTSFTLSKTATTATVLLFIDGVRQTPGDAYSVSGTTLTTTGTTPSGTDNVTVQFLGDVVDFGEPSDDSVTSAKMADDAVGVAELSATGTASSSTYLRGDNSWATISEYDDSGLQDDIAILGFKVASNGSLGKYDLVDQAIDDFQDATGIDSSLSSEDTRDSTGKYYSGSIGGNDSFTELLLHMDGSDGGTTFTDSSSNGLTVTSNGGAHTDTTVKKFGTASAEFDGSDDYLSIADNAIFFTKFKSYSYECWVRFKSLPSSGNAMNIWSQNHDNHSGQYFRLTNNSGTYEWRWMIYSASDSNQISLHCSDSVAIDTWYHVVCARNGETCQIFVDGVSLGSETISDSSEWLEDYNRNFEIGRWSSSAASEAYLDGYIDEFRFSAGNDVDRTDRTSDIAVTSSFTWAFSSSGNTDGEYLVNGLESDDDDGGGWMPSMTVDSSDYVRFDFGSGKIYKSCEWLIDSSGASDGTWKWQGSNDAASWTDIGSSFSLGYNSDSNLNRFNISSNLRANTTSYRYYQLTGVSGSTNTSGRRLGCYFGTTNGGARWGANFSVNTVAYEGITDMTLVSTATTAEATPTTGDIVMTYTNGAGTATVNTDLKAYVSRDNGTTWTQATLSSEGTTGGHTILTAHNVDISSQPSGTSMRYKIETLNQSASKETRIQAVSLGWS